jgi:hypothetical protein
MMAQYANLENGVAPIWVATGDGNYTPTKNCIGFYVTNAGAVTFTSGGSTITTSFLSGQFVTGQISSFSASGTTATGIYALVI